MEKEIGKNVGADFIRPVYKAKYKGEVLFLTRLLEGEREWETGNLGTFLDYDGIALFVYNDANCMFKGLLAKVVGHECSEDTEEDRDKVEEGIKRMIEDRKRLGEMGGAPLPSK